MCQHAAFNVERSHRHPAPKTLLKTYTVRTLGRFQHPQPVVSVNRDKEIEILGGAH